MSRMLDLVNKIQMYHNNINVRVTSGEFGRENKTTATDYCWDDKSLMQFPKGESMFLYLPKECKEDVTMDVTKRRVKTSQKFH